MKNENQKTDSRKELIFTIRDQLEAAYRKASDELKAVSGVGSGNMGMTPDTVKALPEYKSAKYKMDGAFLALRNFNKKYAKLLKQR